MNQEKISIRNTIKEQMPTSHHRKVGEMSLAFVPTLLQHPRIKRGTNHSFILRLTHRSANTSIVKELKKQGKDIVLPVVTGETTMES